VFQIELDKADFPAAQSSGFTDPLLLLLLLFYFNCVKNLMHEYRF
jgi:hypothetical protein